MARQLVHVVVPLLLFASLCLFCATASEETASTEYDLQKEIEKLKGWKSYLSTEVDKWKAEAEKAQAALLTEQQRSADFAAQLDQYKKASEYAETKAAEATQLSAQVEQLKKDTESAQALATSHATYSSQLSTQLEELKQTASAYAAAADASNGETALLRTQLAEAVAERQAMDERITQLASATAKAGGLRGHALGIYNILLEEVDRHRETALNYANEKLPGFKAKVAEAQAKVAEVHATVSSQMPNVTGHVGDFVSNVDRELRPWLRQTLGSVPALKQYSEDPVVLQGIVVFILGAPVLLLLLPVLSCFFRVISRRPSTSTGRGSEGKSARRGKKKQG